MINEVIRLRGEDNSHVTLTTYILDDIRGNIPYRPAIVVCPGGAYQRCSDIEGEPVAMRFAAVGFHTFVLNYSVYPERYPKALEELSMSVELIRENAEKWHIDVNKIAVCGFSAGGHLAASLGVFWNTPPFASASQKNKPNALVLCYPVISSGEYGHIGSIEALCGDDKELFERMSLENRVSCDTPKTFIWHTFDDEGVPMENSLLFANALKKNNIPFEMHIYPTGRHGLSIINKDTGLLDSEIVSINAPQWVENCCNWLLESM